MADIGKKLLAMLLAVVLSGCASSGGMKQLNSADMSATCKPVIYNKIDSSEERRPVWINNIKPDSNGNHFITGMSKFHSTERDARDEAMRHARAEFAKYTGVEVTELDQFSEETYGSSSSVLDATVLGKVETTMQTDALVSRTRAKEWYFEKLAATCMEQNVGTAYQYWVLALVPQDEYDAVQRWKERKQQRKAELAKENKTRISQDIEQIRSDHQRAIVDTEQALSSTDPITALSILQEDWSRLFDEVDSFKKQGLSSEAATIDRLQREIPARMQKIKNSILIDAGRETTLFFSVADDAVTFPAWAGFRQGNRIDALQGISLQLVKSGDKRPVAKCKTSSVGECSFTLKNPAEGSYEIRLNLDNGVSLTPAIKKMLVSIKTDLQLAEYKPDMQGAARVTVRSLFTGPSYAPPAVSTVVIGSVRYEDTRLGSRFGSALNRLIKQELAQLSYIKKIEKPNTRGISDLKYAAQTRGIRVNDKNKKKLSMSSPAMQAKMDNADASLETRYYPEGDTVKLVLKLIKAGTGEIVAFRSAVISRNYIPAKLEIRPPKQEDEIVPYSAGSSVNSMEINLELTTNRGDGVTFADGEEVTFYVSSDQDAYLMLLYQDAAGHLIRIYPNGKSGDGYHRADDFMAIPDENAIEDSFSFAIEQPFGVEKIWAFASKDPFPDIKGQEIGDNGLLLLNDGLDEVIENLRSFSRKNRRAYGEANVVITTVKE